MSIIPLAQSLIEHEQPPIMHEGQETAAMAVGKISIETANAKIIFSFMLNNLLSVFQ
jgi:hypothetical protein